MKKTIIIVFIIGISFLQSCYKDEKEEPVIDSFITYDLNGNVQKGPFLAGTNLIVSELNENLEQTGKTFFGEIEDDLGFFQISNINVESQYVNINANGFYFNEVTNTTSASQINLNAIADLSDRNTLNINILTHLEKSRVKKLISQGVKFDEAKKQAQAEIFAIFNIELEETVFSELLDISQSGDANGALLAISVFLQGFRSEAEFTELLTHISTDIKDDGILDNQEYGSQLLNHAIYLDSAMISKNLKDRFEQFGNNYAIPDFFKHITNFIEKTSFEVTERLIKYPTTGSYGPNILALDFTEWPHGEANPHSAAVELPENMGVKIKYTKLTEGYGFAYVMGSNLNWTIDWPEMYSNTQVGGMCDLKVIIEGPPWEVYDSILVEYFETSSIQPTFSKVVHIIKD